MYFFSSCYLILDVLRGKPSMRRFAENMVRGFHEHITYTACRLPYFMACPGGLIALTYYPLCIQLEFNQGRETQGSDVEYCTMHVGTSIRQGPCIRAPYVPPKVESSTPGALLCDS